MNAKDIQNIINKDTQRRQDIETSRRYYDNENDILKGGVNPSSIDSDPLRNADNRISNNYHQDMVDEKASYMFTYPVLFDLDNNKELNKLIETTLGDDFESISKDLCIEASNCATAWIHYWIDIDTNKFEYAMVDTNQIIPTYDGTLKKRLAEIYRYYESTVNGEDAVIFEHWTGDTFTKYTLKGSLSSGDLKLIEEPEEIIHSLERVPFIEFANNKRKQSDLKKYKHLIDLVDKVLSGFANDLEDIQQVIYILEDYGGEDLKEFLGDLKRYKAINTDTGAGGGGVKTLQIDIPVDARKVILDELPKRIYDSGQALDRNNDSFGQASGVALKFFYRKLELKAGLTETEFKKGFNELIRAILRHFKKDVNVSIQQTYTRNMISNDLENAQIAQVSAGLLPRKLIWKNHPWVESVEHTEMLMKEEEQEIDPYDIEGLKNG